MDHVTRFGEIAVSMGFVKPSQVDAARLHQRSLIDKGHRPPPLGVVLVDMGYLASQDIFAILSEAERVQRPTRDSAEMLLDLGA